MYKDIFYNHRRFRAGLSNSPNCSICGEVETLYHMLFDCDNARRIWGYCSQICNTDDPDSLYDAVCVTESYEIEIVKTLVFKALTQIDRSRDMCLNEFRSRLLRLARIEEQSKYGSRLSALLNN